MPLPRSVKEITVSDDLPRRIKSDHFRGFSFIQDGFALPERDPSTMDNYWNAEAEDEGESDSDIASSKCALEDTAPAEPAKKKRPPRKKKKKKKNAETASLVSSAHSEPGDKATETTTNAPESTPGISTITANTSSTPKAEVKEEPKLPEPVQQTAASETPQKPSPPPKPVKKGWQSIGQSSGGKTKNSNRRQQAMPSRGATTNASATPYNKPGMMNVSATPYSPPLKTPGQSWNKTPSDTTPQSSNRPNWATPASATAQQLGATPQLGPPVASPQPHQAQPGSWAARIQSTPSSTAVTPSSIVTEPSQTPTLSRTSYSSPSKQPHSQPAPPSPSGDWRSHKSPQVQRVLNRTTNLRSSPPRPSNLMNDGPPQWPSLNDFPAPSGKSQPQAQVKKQLNGAWAAKS
jgi:hypothetical protein